MTTLKDWVWPLPPLSEYEQQLASEIHSRNVDARREAKARRRTERRTFAWEALCFLGGATFLFVAFICIASWR